MAETRNFVWSKLNQPLGASFDSALFAVEQIDIFHGLVLSENDFSMDHAAFEVIYFDYFAILFILLNSILHQN